MPDHQTFNLTLVVLSYVVSVLGSFTALQLAVAIPEAQSTRQRFGAIVAAGAVMGVGAIWAMHFIGMLACDMGMPVTYELSMTIMSAVIAFVSCSLGLGIASSGTFGWGKLFVGGLFMGLGVTGMHYLGMAAMMMGAFLSYDMNIVMISMLIAVVASIAALWLAFNMRGPVQMVGSALVMGVAVCGMHYTGMAAVSMDDNGSQLPTHFADGIRGDHLGETIFVLVLGMLIVILGVLSVRQRRRAALSI